MTRHLPTFVATISFAALASTAWAQDEAPKAAAPAAKAPTAAAELAAPPSIAPKRDPAVDTIVDSNPKTPGQLLRAAALLADLDRIDLARRYLQQLAASNVDEAALADAATEIDPVTLMRLAENKNLQPEGRQLADAVLAAAAKLERDPQRLQAEINRLADPSLAVKLAALTKILAAHEAAVPALVVALGDANRASIHPVVKETLVKIGSQAVPPLVTAFQSDNPALMIDVADVVAQIGSRDAVMFLAGPATADVYPAEVRAAARQASEQIQGVKNPTRDDAIKLLSREIQRYQQHARPLIRDAAGNVDVWRWDASLKAPVRDSLPAELAEAAIAARSLGLDLLRLTDERLAKRLVTLSTLDYLALSAPPDDAARRNELERGFKFTAADIPTIEDTLAYAMATGHLAAATAGAEILGTIGDASLLRSHDATVRPLVKAVEQGDRRLRFAAAEAIMKLKPTGPFAGSSNLMSALAYFADSPGIRRAIVAFPTDPIAGQLAVMLGSLGYQVDVVTNGHRAYLQALSSGDYELILLSGRIDHPPVWVTLQQLRHEPAVARLPIGLLAETGDVPYLESVAAEDGSNRSPPRSRNGLIGPGGEYTSLVDSEFGDGHLTAVFERPLTVDGMRFFVSRLEDRAASEIVPADLRQKQAIAALGWLKQLNEISPRDFDLRPFEPVLLRALMRSATSAAVAELLALDGSHAAQKALVDLASSSIQPLAMRQSAAAAFSAAVRKYGIQLTTGEIQTQYDRYNLSGGETREVQQILALILDAIEFPTRK